MVCVALPFVITHNRQAGRQVWCVKKVCGDMAWGVRHKRPAMVKDTARQGQNNAGGARKAKEWEGIKGSTGRQEGKGRCGVVIIIQRDR